MHAKTQLSGGRTLTVSLAGKASSPRDYGGRKPGVFLLKIPGCSF